MQNLKYKNFYTKYITKYEIHGKDMVCICPFHDENTASMHIDLIKGGYHCFGCDAHGNAREFVENLKDKYTTVKLKGEQQPNVLINTMFDTKMFSQKPQGVEIGAIKNRIENELQMRSYTLSDFIENFAKGITLVPAGIKGNAETNWKGQQVFLLDFDNKDLEKYVTVEKILEYCNKIGLTPTCIYNTFSHTEEVNKFRLVFVFKNMITEYKTATRIINALFEIFKQYNPDTSKKNLSDMFFGGKAIAFKSNIVYTAEIIENEELSKEDFKNLPPEKMDHTEIADIIIQENNLCLFNGDIYIYNNGRYNNSLQLLEQKIVQIYKKANKRMREEVQAYLKILLENNQIEIDNNYINFRNGLYSIKERKLVSHTPNVFTINQLAISYNPSVNIDKNIENFLNQITCNNKQRKDTILQIIGYAMTSSVEFQKAFIFYGRTAANGKSTLLEIINQLIGLENICHVSIQNLQDKFYASELQNKLLNSVSELSSLTLRTAEIFKSVITGDRVSTEKKFKDRKQLKLYAKHIFTTNELFKMSNPDKGFYRRLNILNFEAQFTKEEKANFDINKLLTTNALEYLAMIALNAYHLLLESKKFANEEESEKLLGIYKLENNSALAFLNDTIAIENIIGDNKNYIPQSYLWYEYKKWCQRNGLEIIGRNKFYVEVLNSKMFQRYSIRNTDYLKFIEKD